MTGCSLSFHEPFIIALYVKVGVSNLYKLGIIYDDIIFGLPSGDRILINDRKNDNIRNTAYSINVTRNKGLYDYDFSSKHVTINDNNNFDKIIKPWGSEELLECNDKYVVKRLFMKKDCCCSLQYHELKKESIYVISGLLKILIGKDIDNLEEKIYKPNEYILEHITDYDMFVYPSIFEETFCASALEAMAAGLHIITTNFGALPETCAEWPIYVNYTRNPELLARGFANAIDVASNYLHESYIQNHLEEQQKFYKRFYNWKKKGIEWQNFLKGALNAKR